jgi:hypothetical protein
MAEVLRPALALLPVASFLAVLVLLDSYKLVRLRAVVGVVLAGMLVAGVAYAVNGALLPDIKFATYTRYVAPPVEEALKALVIAALIRAHRIGFLVDGAIFGFAVGTGFAMVENLDYLAIEAGGGAGKRSCPGMRSPCCCTRRSTTSWSGRCTRRSASCSCCRSCCGRCSRAATLRSATGSAAASTPMPRCSS